MEHNITINKMKKLDIRELLQETTGETRLKLLSTLLEYTNTVIKEKQTLKKAYTIEQVDKETIQNLITLNALEKIKNRLSEIYESEKFNVGKLTILNKREIQTGFVSETMEKSDNAYQKKVCEDVLQDIKTYLKEDKVLFRGMLMNKGDFPKNDVIKLQNMGFVIVHWPYCQFILDFPDHEEHGIWLDTDYSESLFKVSWTIAVDREWYEMIRKLDTVFDTKDYEKYEALVKEKEKSQDALKALIEDGLKRYEAKESSDVTEIPLIADNAKEDKNEVVIAAVTNTDAV